VKDIVALIIFFVVLAGAGTVVRLLLAGVAAGTSAAVRSATGKGSFSGNFNASMWGMSLPEYRIVDSRLGGTADGPLVKEVQIKGMFRLQRTVRLGAVTHVYDTETKLPLICALDQFQESDTVVFKFQAELGRVSPRQGLVDWARVGVILPDIMQPPLGGRRRLHAIVRFIDLDDPPPIKFGLMPHELSSDESRDSSSGKVLFQRRVHPGLMWDSGPIPFEHTFAGKGFQEASEEEEEALEAAVKVAVYVAMADGTLHEAEGEAISEWIRRTVEGLGETRQRPMKDRLNGAFKSTFTDSSRRHNIMSEALAQLRAVENTAVKYQVLQLAFDVLTADGDVDPSEMRVIDRIASALSLDVKEVERIRDQKLVGLGEQALASADIESVLGIDPSWDRQSIQRHLRTEFQKWNGRLATLPEGAERQSAQRMLELIAEARQKYG
jgi:tellurite resistance protein